MTGRASRLRLCAALLIVAANDGIFAAPLALASEGVKIGRETSTPAIKAAAMEPPIAKFRPARVVGNRREGS